MLQKLVKVIFICVILHREQITYTTQATFFHPEFQVWHKFCFIRTKIISFSLYNELLNMLFFNVTGMPIRALS